MFASTSLRTVLFSGTAFAALACALPGAALAQVADDETTTQPANTPTTAETPNEGADVTSTTADTLEEERGAIVVTGSRIRRDPNDSSLPLQIVTTQELERNSISNPEQFVNFLSTNGTGSDNLASNSDVVSGQQRGNNGASFANLRGQGSSATLILLNGRRVASHGLNGSAVDVNQIPFGAIERVEVLKDGASAIYGTDAIGGVINFITRKDYEGIGLSAFSDITDEGDAPIYRLSGIVGYGDLRENGFNVMAAVSYSDIAELRGDRRSFVDTFQVDRGLSPDTRGTPTGTIFPLGVGPNTPLGTIILSGATAPFLPGSTTIRASGGINVLDLPGAEGCAAVGLQQEAYADDLWLNPTARLACSYDTGLDASLQQELETLTYLGRGVARLGEHELFVELTGSDADAAKRFSNVQITPNTSTQNYGYPSSGANYTNIFNRLVAVFPGLEARRGLPIAYRWRCIECGPREIETNTKTFRAAVGADGPLFGRWDYRTGLSYAESKSRSALGSGYYFRGTLGNGQPDPNAPIAPGATVPGLIGLLNTGIINPFILPGQAQTQAARDALAAVSAEGVVLYGGKYSVTQFDGSVSGPLFNLGEDAVQLAFGVDYRREKYSFNGDERAAAARPVIIAAPFDDGNALEGVSRDVKAAYAEILVPLFEMIEISGALRIDEYDGFGSTTNPKIAAKFEPVDWLLFRASYNTGFRVPTFNQIFNDQIESIFGGTLADPRDCPGGVIQPTNPQCQGIRPDIINGGNPNIGPETSEEFGGGVVFRPSRNFSASVDYYNIRREGTIITPTLAQLIANLTLVQDRFIRDASGALVAIDQTVLNAGASRTEGLEVSVRGGFDVGEGTIAAGLDGSYLLKKEEQVIASAPFTDQRGVFTFSGDLGLKWKHNAFVSYSTDQWGVSLTQLFRNGYRNQQLPGVASGAVDPPNDVIRTRDYILYNLSAFYRVGERFKLTAGVKNLLDRDPPFAISYDTNTGGGSSWEPRVADPRGRSFTIQADVKF
jgi:iron complex outermembrane recepter protein